MLPISVELNYAKYEIKAKQNQSKGTRLAHWCNTKHCIESAEEHTQHNVPPKFTSCPFLCRAHDIRTDETLFPMAWQSLLPHHCIHVTCDLKNDGESQKICQYSFANLAFGARVTMTTQQNGHLPFCHYNIESLISWQPSISIIWARGKIQCKKPLPNNLHPILWRSFPQMLEIWPATSAIIRGGLIMTMHTIARRGTKTNSANIKILDNTNPVMTCSDCDIQKTSVSRHV